MSHLKTRLKHAQNLIFSSLSSLFKLLQVRQIIDIDALSTGGHGEGVQRAIVPTMNDEMNIDQYYDFESGALVENEALFDGIQEEANQSRVYKLQAIQNSLANAGEEQLEQVLQVLAHPPVPSAQPQQQVQALAPRPAIVNACVAVRPEPEGFQGWQGHWDAERVWHAVREHQQSHEQQADEQQAQEERAQPMANQREEQPMALQQDDGSVDWTYHPGAEGFAAASAAVALPQEVAPAHVPDVAPQQQLPRLRLTIGSLRAVGGSASVAVTVSSGSSDSMDTDAEDGPEAPHGPVEVSMGR